MSELERRLRDALPRIAEGAPTRVTVPAPAARRSAMARRRTGRWAVLAVPVAAAALVAGTVWLAQPARRTASPPAVTRSANDGVCPPDWSAARPGAAAVRYGLKPAPRPAPSAAAARMFSWDHPNSEAGYQPDGSDVRVLVGGRLVEVIHLVPVPYALNKPDYWRAESVTAVCVEVRDSHAPRAAALCPTGLLWRPRELFDHAGGIQLRGYPSPDAAANAWIEQEPPEDDVVVPMSSGEYWVRAPAGRTGTLIVKQVNHDPADWRVVSATETCSAWTPAPRRE